MDIPSDLARKFYALLSNQIEPRLPRRIEDTWLQPDEKLFPIPAKAFEVGIPASEAFEAIGFPKLTVSLFTLLTFKEIHITALTDNGVAGRQRHKN